MIDITTCDSPSNKRRCTKDEERTIGRDLREYMKKYTYNEVKFLNDSKEGGEMARKILKMAIRSQTVRVPEGIPLVNFSNKYRKLVPKELTALRHNAQTLARKNWRGKKKLSCVTCAWLELKLTCCF